MVCDYPWQSVPIKATTWTRPSLHMISLAEATVNKRHVAASVRQQSLVFCVQ